MCFAATEIWLEESGWNRSQDATVPFGWRDYGNTSGWPDSGRTGNLGLIGRYSINPLVRFLLQVGLKKIHDLLFVGRPGYGIALDVPRASSLNKFLGT